MVNDCCECASSQKQANHTSIAETSSHSLEENRTRLENGVHTLEESASQACPGLYVETDGESANHYLHGKSAATPPGPLTPTRGPVAWGRTTPSRGMKYHHRLERRSSPSFARFASKDWATHPGPRANPCSRRESSAVSVPRGSARTLHLR